MKIILTNSKFLVLKSIQSPSSSKTTEIECSIKNKHFDFKIITVKNKVLFSSNFNNINSQNILYLSYIINIASDLSHTPP